MTEPRLLSTGEIDKLWSEGTGRFTAEVCQEIAQAQDAKTYPLAFAAGVAQQAKLDSEVEDALTQEISNLRGDLERRDKEIAELKAQMKKCDCEYFGNCENDPQKQDYCPLS